MRLVKALPGVLVVLVWLVGACAPAEGTGLPPPGPSAVDVTVTATPDGSAISVDGVPLGNAPKTVKLNPGLHTVKGLKSGYFTAEQKITVSSGEGPMTVPLTLIASH